MAVTRELFDLVKQRHGEYASWAVWNEPKEGDGRLSGGMDDPIFDNVTDDLLGQLNPEYMFVALNFSIGSVPTLMNFHSVDKHIGKLRYALRGSPFWGAYMTDVIKGYSNPNANDTMKFLTSNPNKETEAIELLRDEIRTLGDKVTTLIAFGTKTSRILNRNLSDEYNILQITHYSHYIRRPVGETYKQMVMPKMVQEFGCHPW